MRVMQDTGLKWLGEIPADWMLTKIGGLYSIRNEKVSDKDYPPLSVTNKGILPQLETAAKTNDGEIMAVEHRDYKLYGVQFHPESIMTPEGKKMLSNFIKGE